MASKIGGNDDGSIGDINVTPLVDIMLVLVIILMVTAEFTRYKTINISLPKLKAVAVEKEPHKVTLTVKPDGKIYWYDKQIQLSTLQERLKVTKKKHPNIAVILRAEKETLYQKVIVVLDEVKLAGISRVGLAAESKR